MPGLGIHPGGSDSWISKDDGSAAAPAPVGGRLSIQEITPRSLARINRMDDADSGNFGMTGAISALADDDAAHPYLVGPGDILSVIVWEHPELTNPTGEFRSLDSAGRVVSVEGNIFFPHVGVIKVAGLTVDEIRSMLAAALATTARDPQVDVRVIDYRSQYALVVGDVVRPCKIAISDKPATIIDALNGCDGIRPSVAHRTVVLQRAGNQYPIDVDGLYRNSLLSKFQLRHGDAIYMESDNRNRVFVVGEVSRQAAVTIPVGGLSLADAINDNAVGGLRLETANAGGIYLIRGNNCSPASASADSPKCDSPQIFHLDASSVDALILADQLRLRPRDIVFASSASLVNYARVADKILPSLEALIEAGILLDSAHIH
jgi:polysaccharide export outer membrane protein